jgi:hypothetical protein
MSLVKEDNASVVKCRGIQISIVKIRKRDRERRGERKKGQRGMCEKCANCQKGWVLQ